MLYYIRFHPQKRGWSWQEWSPVTAVKSISTTNNTGKEIATKNSMSFSMLAAAPPLNPMGENSTAMSLSNEDLTNEKKPTKSRSSFCGESALSVSAQNSPSPSNITDADIFAHLHCVRPKYEHNERLQESQSKNIPHHFFLDISLP